ncbi:MAG: hypothetical protein H0W08_01795 [Acidobacteria bacterium]|nr:hypothetical protein [Acidobacteriota bacterium]
MSIRLFHRDARIVLPRGVIDGAHVWFAAHRRPVAWAALFAPALLLVGVTCQPDGDGLRFGSGNIRWRRGRLGTTIRLRLPPCSEKKAVLLARGLLKVARYGRPADGANS